MGYTYDYVFDWNAARVVSGIYTYMYPLFDLMEFALLQQSTGATTLPGGGGISVGIGGGPGGGGGGSGSGGAVATGGGTGMDMDQGPSSHVLPTFPPMSLSSYQASAMPVDSPGC